MHIRRGSAALLAALLLFGACSIEPPPSVTPGPNVELDQNTEAPPISETAETVEEVLPSVVNVRVTSIDEDPLSGEQARGQGSGVVVDKNGIILTNNHVVERALTVKVVFNDDHPDMVGQVVGTDPERDLAVVRVEADDLDPIELGKSGSMRLGDSVIAVGFPLGLGGPTITQGIISGLERTIRIPVEDPTTGETEVQALRGMLQTDAAINPGNSGGALVDAAGNLIGINTAAGNAASAENLGFAIAIDGALPVVQKILSNPETRPWLGVTIEALDEELAFELGLPQQTKGALVVGLVPGAPAAGAGIREGEVIIGIEDVAVESSEGLTEALENFDPGEVVEVHLMTPEGERTVDLTLALRPGSV
jgi:S1-C subfamily serine protease